MYIYMYGYMSVCVYMYTCVYDGIHAHMQTHTHTHTHTRTHTYTCTRTSTATPSRTKHVLHVHKTFMFFILLLVVLAWLFVTSSMFSQFSSLPRPIPEFSSMFLQMVLFCCGYLQRNKLKHTHLSKSTSSGAIKRCKNPSFTMFSAYRKVLSFFRSKYTT